MPHPAEPEGPPAPVPHLTLYEKQEASRRLWEGLEAHNAQNYAVRDLHMRELAKLLMRWGLV